ncbi:MAG TPA: histidine--tRNA ligase, partial [Myxococcota bacterium]|nr:histidine--tRNA ligase [Myxococcota bacterium]
MAELLQAPKGMVDLLPRETARWQAVEACARDVFRRYGYGEVRTPLAEHTELFARGVGEGTDLVAKQMYTFDDRGGRSVSLRPEGTAGVVRAYLEAGLPKTDPVQKWWYAGAMFRYERMQKGRQRQFHQIGCEVLGLGEPTVDAEAMELLVALYRALGFEAVELQLNSLGCAEDRAPYRAALTEFLRARADRLSEDSRRRLEQNPLRVLDSKDPRDVEAAAGAPAPIDHLCAACRAHHDGVERALRGAELPFVAAPRLVRGLDYYTRTVFELVDRGGRLGAQDALAGGGRYDGLVAELGGPPTPACGWALGLERLLLALPEAGGAAA